MRKTRKPESRMFYTVSFFFFIDLFESSSELSGLIPEQRTLPHETSQHKHLHFKNKHALAVCGYFHELMLSEQKPLCQTPTFFSSHVPEPTRTKHQIVPRSIKWGLMHFSSSGVRDEKQAKPLQLTAPLSPFIFLWLYLETLGFWCILGEKMLDYSVDNAK